MIKSKNISYSIVFLLFSLIQLKANAQEFHKDSLNQVYLDSYIDKIILYGNYDAEGVKESSVFRHNYNRSIADYSFDTTILMSQIEKFNDIEIIALFGSWCPDSQREVPRFLEILKIVDYPMDMLTILAVDRNKVIDGIDVSKYDLKFVPTFIIIKDGKELGRIIEEPKVSLESDLVEILYQAK